ncbi:MAG: hypothetical protein QOH37_2569 [Nocardioidaceae bacterium]|jgi:hypothetical protein|nr:hypothetical protein [Nocardioidaceae bacterium]
MDNPTQSLTRLTRALVGTEPEAPLALRLCTALVAVVGLDGGAITIGFAESERTTLCATDQTAEKIEDLQDMLREGPGLDAYRTGELVLLSRDEQGRAWPMLVQALGETHQPEFVLGVPMSPRSDVLGAATLYYNGSEPPTLDLAEVRFLVNAVGVAILGTFERNDEPETVWSMRDRVHQATGMIVAQLRIRPHDALAVLRAHAYAHGATVDGIADAVLRRELDFRIDDAFEG